MNTLEKRLALAGLGLTGIGTLIALLEYCAPLPTPNAAQNDARVLSQPIVLSTQPSSDDGALDRIFALDLIGKDIDVVEQVSGPSSASWQDRYGQVRQYEAGGCKVDLTVKDGFVSEAKFYTSPTCNVPWRKFAPGYADLPQPNRLTFGDLFESERAVYFSADCLAMCGNAADPVYHLITEASHADGWLKIDLEAAAIYDQTNAAISAMTQEILGLKGEQFLIDMNFCDFDIDGLAKRHLQPVRVTAVILRGDRDDDPTWGRCRKG